MSLVPNVSPKAFSASAVIVGYLLIDDMTANEQNALGNWLMLVAQVLSTNAFYKQVQDERRDNRATRNGTTHQENSGFKDEVQILEKMVVALNQEIENLKASMKN